MRCHRLSMPCRPQVSRAMQRSLFLQRLLLVLVLGATCMLIGDGTLTPAISVVSSITGLQQNTNIGQRKQLLKCPCIQFRASIITAVQLNTHDAQLEQPESDCVCKTKPRECSRPCLLLESRARSFCMAGTSDIVSSSAPWNRT